MANHLVVVRINSNYRASVYDVNDLKRYVEDNSKDINYRLLAVEETPRHISNVSSEMDAGYAAHLESVKTYVKCLQAAQVVIGSVITLERNQGRRLGTILWVTKSGEILIYYTMPNGAIYFNLIDSIYTPDIYAAIPFSKVVKAANDEQKQVLYNELTYSLDELEVERDSSKYNWRLNGSISKLEMYIYQLTHKTI